MFPSSRQVGSFHWTSKKQISADAEPQDPVQQRQLKKLNLALELHGLPPLPFFPEATDAETVSIDSLIDGVVQGQPLSPDLLNLYREAVDPSLFRTMHLAPVAMPGISEGLANSPWSSSHRTGFAQVRRVNRTNSFFLP